MPISATFNATQKAATFIPLLNELANGVFTVAAAQTVGFTAVKGYLYPLATTGLTVTLPLAPGAGDRIRFAATTSSVVSVTFDRNGESINGAAANKAISGGAVNLALEVIFLGGSTGWLVIENTEASGVFEVKATTFTAASRGTYAITASSFTATLPASPVAGDWVRLFSGDAAVSAITLGRNGSKINSASSDFVINAKQWNCLAYYVDSTVGWLLAFGTAINPAARWDSTDVALRYHNSQREISATVGWEPYALPLGQGSGDSINAAGLSLPISGGSVAVPMRLVGHMLLQSVTVRSIDTTAQRDLEWRLYKQRLNNGNGGENTLDEIPGANGTLSFTPSAASNRTSTPGAPPIYLAPGLYWLVMRNTSGTQTFSVGRVVANALNVNVAQTKTLGSSLGATLDLVAATWAKTSDLPVARLDGRVFGQTTAF